MSTEPLPPRATGAPDQVGPLSGFAVAVTAARRRVEFGTALERKGAEVVYGPAIEIQSLEDDDTLRAVTQACIDAPPDIVVATTGIGFRGWIDAADSWGLGGPLLEALGRAQLYARGPKVVGAMHAAGLFGEWSPASESSSEVLERLLTTDLQDRRLVIQLHGEPLPDVVDALRAAGAEVVEAQVYRWLPHPDAAPLARVCQLTAARELDCVTFTSAPAAASFLQASERDGFLPEVLAALQGEVLAAAVGPVTAAPLQRAGVPVLHPARSRLGALVREIAEQVPARRAHRLVAAGHRLEVRGRAVLVDGVLVTPGRTGMALLRRLTAHPGQVLTRAELGAGLPGGDADPHAVEVSVGRLRSALGDPRIVQTVVKRGYRLAFEPEADVTWRY
ncbi:uroporphyrinogen-III synthase [Nakamurella leprariae]|uniref:Uroporphyrinogen-III synthase n=1 Tax=Nakamurella leprariae TaxID=2803911 RepID=A0A939C147_9ACTN|nr:uroporphyrinogen-III synthase [Nakamurella leprariae]MBM9466749.1 uroporphyrinogen-III synthase [Nakamurella leprariae]